MSRAKVAADNLWFEFVVNVDIPMIPDRKVPLCGLCANSGIVDTRTTAVSPSGTLAGIRAYCICPNGRALKESGQGF